VGGLGGATTQVYPATSPMIWTDDTYVTVLGGEKLGSHKGRFWVYIGHTVAPCDVYDFMRIVSGTSPRGFW
jgi:hypothetical protein